MAFCSGCGAELSDTAGFCSKCGRAASASGASIPGPTPTPTTSNPLSDNLAAALSYFLVPAIIFLVVEPYKSNRLVRFHCFQSIFFFVLSMVSHIIISIPIAGLFLWPILEIAIFIVWVMLFIKALQGQMWRLPYLGDLAAEQAAKA